MRPVVFDPGLFGQYGGPANGGFAGTGTNTSTAPPSPGRACSARATVLDVRGGLNYYHNVTATAGQRTDDQHRGRHSRRQHRRLHQRPLADQHRRLLGDPVLGFSASQPWDRSEKTWNIATTLTRLMHSAHRQVRRRVAEEPRPAAADAGCRRAARPVQLQRLGHRLAERNRHAQRRGELDGLVPARLAERRAARSEGHRPARHQALGDVVFVHDKWQARST